jgi:hypothetical protein
MSICLAPTVALRFPNVISWIQSVFSVPAQSYPLGIAQYLGEELAELTQEYC